MGGAGSLRDCVIWANGNPSPDTIVVPADTYILTLTNSSENGAATGDLDITEDLIIKGAGMHTTIIDGNASDRVFDIIAGSVSMSDVKIQNGNPGSGNGAGINNIGTSPTSTRVIISGNTATGHGGGV